MKHDFNKPPHVTNAEEVKQKKRIPVFMLIIAGIFLASLIFYMLADKEPKAGSVPANESVPAVKDTSS
jgi:hypothetical protein